MLQSLPSIRAMSTVRENFADADIMGLANEENPHCVPTYQWWLDNGELSCSAVKAIHIRQSAILMLNQVDTCYNLPL